ncbi:uncharacterized protein [Leptinotarsa decemlineata]|uniref:uncharacterized protein n=1 Tax=Leptinotarsa decemlineata TaxID=7539 RepID=UPI003D30C9A6
MDELKLAICRLCLERMSPNRQHSSFEELCSSQRLSFILPDKTSAWALNHPICTKCSEELQKAYEFKVKCLEIEQKVRGYLDNSNASTVELQDVLFANKSECESNKTICRLCCSTSIDGFTKLDIFNNKALGQMLLQCLPEVDIGSTYDPKICKTCFENLKQQHMFTLKCLRVEEKISEYLAQQGSCIEEVDPMKMLQCLAQNPSTQIEAVVLKMEAEIKEETMMEGVESVDSEYSPQPKLNSVQTNIQMNSVTVIPPTRLYSCKKCSFSAASDAEVKYHFVEAHNSNGKLSLYECDSCSFVTRHWNVWSNHKLIHLSEDQIVWLNCEKCTYRSKLKGNLEKHMLTHSSSEEKRFKCQECPYQSMWKRDLERHLVKHQEPDQVTKYGCHLCSFSTKHQRYLKFHVQKVHVGEERGDEIFYCAQCNFTTRQKRSLVPHMLTHRNPDELVTYRCQFCPYEAKWKKSVKMHEEIHIKTFSCDLCDFVTKQKRFLKEHIRGHEPLEKPVIYTCGECEFKTIYKHSIVKHGLIHKKPEEVTMHCCQQCEYKSKRSQDLRQHILAIHTEDATIYECDECQYKTKYRGGLRTHKNLQHKNPDEVKKFRCSVCPFETKYKSSLLSHEEALHKKFDEASLLKCPLCCFKTKRRECLTKHSVVHETNGERFQCYDCGFETKYKRALRRHVMGHKPERWNTKRAVKQVKDFEEIKIEAIELCLDN